jgi:hypothetical protein
MRSVQTEFSHIRAEVIMAGVLSTVLTLLARRPDNRGSISGDDQHFSLRYRIQDLLCGLLVKVPGYTSRGLGSIPVLPHFLRSSVSGTGSTQPRQYNCGAA